MIGVFQSDHQYGWFAGCTEVLDDEILVSVLEPHAARWIPEEYLRWVRYFCKPLTDLDWQWIAVGYASWVCWKYTPPGRAKPS